MTLDEWGKIVERILATAPRQDWPLACWGCWSAVTTADPFGAFKPRDERDAIRALALAATTDREHVKELLKDQSRPALGSLGPHADEWPRPIVRLAAYTAALRLAFDLADSLNVRAAV